MQRKSLAPAVCDAQNKYKKRAVLSREGISDANIAYVWHGALLQVLNSGLCTKFSYIFSITSMPSKSKPFCKIEAL